MVFTKKFFSIAAIFVLALSLSACGLRGRETATGTNESGYKYENKGLGFSLKLPVEFQYYQTQRKDMADFVDLEIFVPTADSNYPQEVPGYVKPLVVRIYNRGFWEGMKEDGEERSIYEKVGEKGEKIYALGFWKTTPADWQNKWTDEMKEKIKATFKIE